MKSIYDLINDVKVKKEGYSVTPLNDLEKASMKQKFRSSKKQLTHKQASHRWMAAAACIACVVCFSQTAFAKDMLNGIIKSISVGHNTVVQMDPNAKVETSKWYDKNGKLLTDKDLQSAKGVIDLYDANGKSLGQIGHSKSSDPDEGVIIEKDLKKATAQLSFSAKLPKTVPAGYAFEKAELYKDDNDKASPNYLDFIYKNGNSQINIQERRDTQETAYTTGTDGTLEEVKINGHTAALSDGYSLDWEADGVSISITAKKLSRDELLAFAESFQ